MLTFGAKADDSDDARQIIGNCAIYDFSFSTFQLVYASPDTSCVFIFPLIGERENLVLFLFKCTIYKNVHFFHVKLMKMKVFLNAINDV